MDDEYDLWIQSIAERSYTPELTFAPELLDVDTREWLYELFRTMGAIDAAQLTALCRQRIWVLSLQSLEVLDADFSSSMHRPLGATLISDKLNLRPGFLSPEPFYISSQSLTALAVITNVLQMADFVQDLVFEREGLLWPECERHERPAGAVRAGYSVQWECSSAHTHFLRQLVSLDDLPK